MWGGSYVLVAAMALLAEPCVANKYNITVGYLPCITGGLRDRQGLAMSGAISLALENINNSTEILPDVTLLLQWADTKCDTLITMRLLIDMICSGVVAFFGPEERCQMAAVNAQFKNLPMISYKCSDNQVSTLPNFATLAPSVSKETYLHAIQLRIKGALNEMNQYALITHSDTNKIMQIYQITKSVVSLLRYYRWNKFSILYEIDYTTAALTLENYARMANMTLNHQRLVDDFWDHIIQDTKDTTRIYVYLGSTSELVEMMNTMETLQLFASGEYMVIFLDMIPSWPKEPSYYLTSKDRPICSMTAEFKKRARSLLVVASSDPDSRFDNFARQVREYNTKKPFPFLPITFGNQNVPIYAVYLYDSVRLYATALHKIIEEKTVQKNETLTYEKLMSVATNGSGIVSKMIEITPFNSVSGGAVHLDELADANGNYSVLAYKPLNHTNCIHSMAPVGHFQKSEEMFPVYKLYPRLHIDWPDYVKPEDEPLCGFHNDKC